MDFTNDRVIESLKEMLRVSKAGLLVVFTKQDGTEREMRCTLNDDAIPQEQLPKPLQPGEVARAPSTTSLRVFDLEKGEWRAFRYDSIKYIIARKDEE